MEQERGISITSSVLQFDHAGRRLNLVDTPGHADFSEDTYRTLAAVDSAIMLLDVMKGVEERTRRLFEVCRLRRLPILTLINKFDRPGRDPFDVMDEVSRTLGIRTAPLNWPIGEASEFRGVLDLRTLQAHLYDRGDHGASILPERIYALDDPALVEEIGETVMQKLRDDIALLEAGDPWDLAAYLAGDLTPVFFGSAMTNFGVGPFLEAIVELAPPPGPRITSDGPCRPHDPDFAGFVFKIQANMNPKHRDRIAFLRIVSGHFVRGMDVVIARTGATMRLSKPHTFVAADRALVDEAIPGDIVGLFDPGMLRIGDTLTVGRPVRFEGIPRFAPEHFARIKLADPLRRKHLQAGLEQLSQEGAIQLLYREGLGASDPYLGAVGLLQLEVLISRLAVEYKVAAHLDMTRYTAARWIVGAEAAAADFFSRWQDVILVRDQDNRPVVLAASSWTLQYALQQVKGLQLLDISPM